MSPSDDLSASHFDEVTGLLYLEGQLDEGRAREVRAHLASCAVCGELLAALKSESVWLQDALTADDEPIPARVITVPRRGWNALGMDYRIRIVRRRSVHGVERAGGARICSGVAGRLFSRKSVHHALLPRRILARMGQHAKYD